MNNKVISDIFLSYFNQIPQKIERCVVGIGNNVYIVECVHTKYIFRCSLIENAYENTIYWLKELYLLGIPVPKVLAYGNKAEYSYLILNYIEGKDIGLIYQELHEQEKRKIAKDLMEIQRRVSCLTLSHVDEKWSWMQFIDKMLERAENRIEKNGYFDSRKVKQIKELKKCLEEYILSIDPIPYLDDVSTKNLLIYNGQISGIIDVDWIGIGDNLTFIALTYVALLNMNYETDYVDYLLEERGCTDMERRAFLFYSLLFCVDFMGERGMQFGDKTVEVNEDIINKLNDIYEKLWNLYRRQVKI